MRACSTSLVTPRSFEMVVNAGATMEEETGEMKVKEDTTRHAAHLRRIDQFFGLAGSSGPSQETTFGSCCCGGSVFDCSRAGSPFSTSFTSGMPLRTSGISTSTSSSQLSFFSTSESSTV